MFKIPVKSNAKCEATLRSHEKWRVVVFSANATSRPIHLSVLVLRPVVNNSDHNSTDLSRGVRLLFGL